MSRKRNYNSKDWTWERQEGISPDTWVCERCNAETPVSEDYYEGRRRGKYVIFTDICLRCAKELGLAW